MVQINGRIFTILDIQEVGHIKNYNDFVEEMLIVSTMWKAPCDIFHNVVSTIWISHIVEITM